MNFVDVVILLTLAASALIGLRNGFIQSICSLIGLIAGIAIASWNYQLVSFHLEPAIHNHALANVAGFCIIAFAVMILAGLLGMVLKGLIRGIGLGWLDHTIGLIFGLLRGAVLASLCIVLLVAFFPEKDWLRSARVAPYFLGFSQITITITPGELKKKIEDGLYILERDSPAWLQPRNP